MIPVTKTYLPPRDQLDAYIDGIFERGWLTNNGELVRELTRRLQDYLGVQNLLLVANGTLALQVAYRAMGVTPQPPSAPVEAVTTAFTFVATASSLKWEGIEPVFADIDPDTWCLDPSNIEAAVTQHTRAIVPVHVFGNACDVEAIDAIGRNHGLSVIYDGAHAFGVNYRGCSLLEFGDATTLSFHATKLFHSIEGGAIVFREAEHLEKAKKLINFGITGPGRIEGIGINAKMNEFQAAMGLCVLDDVDAIMRARANVETAYQQALGEQCIRQARNPAATNNRAYFPVLLESEPAVERAMTALREADVFARRYFYPSLETVDYLGGTVTNEHADDVARRVICLPMYAELDVADVERIAAIVNRVAASSET